jgi:nicotinate-nucleotide pyrophosphorylase (carboxylating)
MPWADAETRNLRQLLELALAEDLGNQQGDGFGEVGDLTSRLLLPAAAIGSATFVARAPGIVAGLPAIPLVFESFGPDLEIRFAARDGERVTQGSTLAVVQGRMRAILTGERLALNFVQRLSGIATLTDRFVQAVAGLPCRILDTRKTTPGWRRLEKYAVRCGGGQNHRFGLFDGILIKDNHLAALERPDAIRHAIAIARDKGPATVPIEVEVESLDQLDGALAAQPDVIMLDNMDLEALRESVRLRNQLAPAVKLEASGGVTLETVRAIAETGVDFISVGALTHSAPILDVALQG